MTNPCSGRDAGFALVAMIWIAMLLAAIALVFTTAVRSHVREAEARKAVAEAEALSDAAINLALLDLLHDPRASAHSPPAGRTSYQCALQNGASARVSIADEAGKIDLNIANVELFEALFRGMGLSRQDASARAAAISDYRDGDDDRGPNGAERDDYLSLGRSEGPKNAPFEVVEELARVAGFDAESARKLRPYLTVHAQQTGIDPSAAPDGLIALVAGGSDASAASTEALDASVLPPQFTSASTRRHFSIQADVVTGRGARYVREAVVRRIDVSPRRSGERRDLSGTPAVPLPFRILRWHRVEASGEVPSPIGSLPKC